jgi:3-deoxy-D-manno-octulosonic-acid transferase
VFASTIGELNAIEPLLREVIRRLPGYGLTLLSDHPHYEEGFLRKYPAAAFCVIDHRSALIRDLVARHPPALLLLAEIPCMLSEAPCRFPFAAVLEAKRHGARACLVNGWLYGQRPACRMDAVEKALFDRDYLRLLDVLAVQTQDVGRTLISAGAPPDRVFVTGNLKFDALVNADWDVKEAKSPVLLAKILGSRRPVLTAGSVTNIPEQELLLDAFLPSTTLPRKPLLILAPRHPENQERMRTLSRMLSDRGYDFAFKSKLGEPTIDEHLDCLVLDTVGELRDFYAVSALSYVGLNRNILEPLAFGKKVIVTPGWDPVRPAYSNYRMLKDKNFIEEVNRDVLAARLMDCLSVGQAVQNPADFRRSDEYRDLIGATARCLDCLEPVLAGIAAASCGHTR